MLLSMSNLWAILLPCRELASFQMTFLWSILILNISLLPPGHYGVPKGHNHGADMAECQSLPQAKTIPYHAQKLQHNGLSNARTTWFLFSTLTLQKNNVWKLEPKVFGQVRQKKMHPVLSLKKKKITEANFPGKLISMVNPHHFTPVLRFALQ